MLFFFKTYLGGPKEKIWKKGFFQEWRWRNFSLTFLESTLKKDLESINLSSVWFGVSCNIGWVTSVCISLVLVQSMTPKGHLEINWPLLLATIFKTFFFLLSTSQNNCNSICQKIFLQQCTAKRAQHLFPFLPRYGRNCKTIVQKLSCLFFSTKNIQCTIRTPL